MRSKSSRSVGVGFATVASALLVLAVEREAHALPLLTLWGSVRGVYGFMAGDTAEVVLPSTNESEAVNSYGPGVSIAAGVTLPLSLYLGASYDYFFGETASFAQGQEVTRTSSQLLAHVGYDFGFGPLTLRPQLGVGYLFGDAESTGGPPGTEDSEVSTKGAVAAPGAELFLGLGLMNLSAEARYEMVSGNNSNAFVLGLGLGVSL